MGNKRRRKFGRCHDRARRDGTLRTRPDRCRKVAVVVPARNHVPVQVGHDIAEARKIDLVRPQEVAHDGFGGIYNIEQAVTIGNGQIGHLAHMRLPDDAAESRKRRCFRAADTHNAAAPILPENLAAGGITQFARIHAEKIARGWGMAG